MGKAGLAIELPDSLSKPEYCLPSRIAQPGPVNSRPGEGKVLKYRQTLDLLFYYWYPAFNLAGVLN